MTYTIAIAHHAGGVGKTTTTLNLGDALARQGKRVLLVDMDAQGDLSARLGLEDANGLVEAFRGKGDPIPLVKTYQGAAISIIPSNLDMADVEVELVAQSARERKLRRILAPLTARYDYILIDCPPSLSILTQNALWAADGVLVTVQAQIKAYKHLNRVMQTVRRTDVERRQDNPADGLEVFGLVATMVDRSSMAGSIIQRMHDDYGPLVFATTIPHRVGARDDYLWKAPVASFDPDGDIALAYSMLAKEVISRAEAPIPA